MPDQNKTNNTKAPTQALSDPPCSMYGALYGYYCDKIKSTETHGHLFESKSLAQAKREAKGYAANRKWRVREVFKVAEGELNDLIYGGYTIQSNSKIDGRQPSSND